MLLSFFNKWVFGHNELYRFVVKWRPHAGKRRVTFVLFGPLSVRRMIAWVKRECPSVKRGDSRLGAKNGCHTYTKMRVKYGQVDLVQKRKRPGFLPAFFSRSLVCGVAYVPPMVCIGLGNQIQGMIAIRQKRGPKNGAFSHLLECFYWLPSFTCFPNPSIKRWLFRKIGL